MEEGGKGGCSCRRIRSDGSFSLSFPFGTLIGMLVTGWLSTANRCIPLECFSSLAVLISCYRFTAFVFIPLRLAVWAPDTSIARQGVCATGAGDPKGQNPVLVNGTSFLSSSVAFFVVSLARISSLFAFSVKTQSLTAVPHS